MKTLFLSLLLSLLLMVSSSLSAQSQVAWNDTMMVFKTPLELASGGKFLLGENGPFQLQPQSGMRAVSASFAQTASIPRAAKTSTGPVILKNQNGCFAFSCDKSCQSCRLVWYDRNGDGKVQPRRELRCVNAKGKVGRVSVSKVTCQ